ncbi:MAG: SDR family oxidoreductase [Acidobacteria bacterium]|nr:SDR family oxidoreductase [Acidobacteriota bacterium]
MRLAGKVGIVTGAGRGIGRELALAMAREGAALIVNDAGVAVDGAPGAERPAGAVAAEIAARGGTALADNGSVVSHADARAMVARAVRELGRLDFVVNNAGIVRDAIFHKMSEEDWDGVVAVHLKGTFNVSRAAAEIFRAQGAGAVLNMTSTSGLIGSYGQANYAAAKLGIVALTRSIALDMRRFNVRANAIAPFASTRMTETLSGAAPAAGDSDAARRRLERLRSLDASLIAPLAVHLVSDAAAAITGQVFAVRGAEITLFSFPRPVATLYRAGGWDVSSLADQLGALAPQFTPLDVTSDVFPGDPRL